MSAWRSQDAIDLEVNRAHDLHAMQVTIETRGLRCPCLAYVYMKQAFDIWEAAYAGDHPRLCQSLANLGAVARRRGKLNQAEGFYQQALDMEQRLHGPDSVRVATALRRLGETWTDSGRTQQAVAALERATGLFSTHRGANHAQTVSAALGLAAAYEAAGEPTRANRMLRDLARTVADDETQSSRVQEALQ